MAAAIEPLFIANWLARRAVFEWKIVSADGAPVSASNGRCIAVDGDLDAAAGSKSVFVLASFDALRSLSDRRVVRWLKRLARLGVEIGGIENGSLVLAEAGLLNGHTVAVHWDNALGFEEHYPRSTPVSQLFVRSGARITCAGAAAILDLMVAWIGWHADETLASEVADHLVLGRARTAETAQRASAAPPVVNLAVRDARNLMALHVEEPLSCRDVARRVGLSLRQLERRFHDALQCSVLHEYRQIRMAKAHQLLQQTELSVTGVALACGFSPEYFCRLYRELFGVSPSRDRRQSTTAPVLRRSAESMRRRTL
jgi:AraC family carnitine catabolism transcriptional activator